MNEKSGLSLETRATDPRNVDALHRPPSIMDTSPPGTIQDTAPTRITERHEMCATESRSDDQHHRQQETMLRDSRPIDGEDCRIQEERGTYPSNFLTRPLSFLWRRLKWGLILSLGRSDSVFRMNSEDMKAAVATQLEVVIMGSALVLTLCLQIQEVVGSRGGFTLPERDTARFVFVFSSALSFSLAFYSIITSAMMLLSINTMPQHSAEGFLKTLSSWSAIPRLCTLSAAFCLGVAALTAFFLGLESSNAWVGASVMATAILLTIGSTILILIWVKRLQTRVWEEARDSVSADCMDHGLDVENNVVVQQKFRDANNPSLSRPGSQSVLTPLSSLTNTTGFSIRSSSRFRH